MHLFVWIVQFVEKAVKPVNIIEICCIEAMKGGFGALKGEKSAYKGYTLCCWDAKKIFEGLRKWPTLLELRDVIFFCSALYPHA